MSGRRKNVIVLVDLLAENTVLTNKERVEIQNKVVPRKIFVLNKK